MAMSFQAGRDSLEIFACGHICGSAIQADMKRTKPYFDRPYQTGRKEVCPACTNFKNGYLGHSMCGLCEIRTGYNDDRSYKWMPAHMQNKKEENARNRLRAYGG